jgi:hypothetical protein
MSNGSNGAQLLVRHPERPRASSMSSGFPAPRSPRCSTRWSIRRSRRLSAAMNLAAMLTAAKKQTGRQKRATCLCRYSWLRGRDLNPRPLGYEPNESGHESPLETIRPTLS